jgi:hypothetical protein
MDRLETFFIKTVVAAQEQALPTSGAVSTTRLGEFLTGQLTKESIIDKLVSAPISQQTTSEPTKTQQVIPAETIEPKPDEQLLSKLTAPVESSSIDTTIADKKITTEPVEHKPAEQEIKKSILDQLAAPTLAQEKSGEQTGKSQAGEKNDV